MVALDYATSYCTCNPWFVSSSEKTFRPLRRSELVTCESTFSTLICLSIFRGASFFKCKPTMGLWTTIPQLLSLLTAGICTYTGVDVCWLWVSLNGLDRSLTVFFISAKSASMLAISCCKLIVQIRRISTQLSDSVYLLSSITLLSHLINASRHKDPCSLGLLL